MIKHYREEIIFYVSKQEDSSQKLPRPKGPALA